MKKYYLRASIVAVLCVGLFCSSCRGQNQTNKTGSNGTESTETPALEQKLIIHHPGNEYKAAADNVHCGLQDRAGNLWFGTTGDGVYRYDGKSFTNFTMKDGLDSNQILSMAEDKMGYIWFGSGNGLCRYDGKKIATIPIRVINQHNVFPSLSLEHYPPAQNAVWSIMQDKKGTLWFGTDEGVYCFDGKSFTRFLDNPNIINQNSLSLKSVQYMLEDAKGNIWFGSGPMAFEGICLFDGKRLTNFKPKNQQWIRKIVECKNGIILFATRSAGIYYYDPAAAAPAGKKFNSFPAPPEFFPGSLTNILEDKTGVVWMASDYGNNPGDSLGGVWGTQFPGDLNTEKKFIKITNREVFFMLEDKDNNLWLGTRGTGLYRYNRKSFTHFPG